MAWRDGGRLERHRAGSALDPTPHTAGASSVPRTGTCWWPVSHPCRAKLGGDLSFTQLLLFLLSCTQHCHSSCHTMAHARGVQQHQSTSSSQHILYIFLCLLLDAAAARTGCALRCQPGWFAPLGHFLGHPVSVQGAERVPKGPAAIQKPLSAHALITWHLPPENAAFGVCRASRQEQGIIEVGKGLQDHQLHPSAEHPRAH